MRHMELHTLFHNSSHIHFDLSGSEAKLGLYVFIRCHGAFFRLGCFHSREKLFTKISASEQGQNFARTFLKDRVAFQFPIKLHNVNTVETALEKIVRLKFGQFHLDLLR